MESITTKKNNTKNYSFQFRSKKLVFNRYGKDNLFGSERNQNRINKSRLPTKRFKSEMALSKSSYHYKHVSIASKSVSNRKVISIKATKVFKLSNLALGTDKVEVSDKNSKFVSPTQLHENSKQRLRSIVIDSQFKKKAKNAVKAEVNYYTGDDLGNENLSQMHNFTIEGAYNANRLSNRFYQAKQDKTYNIQPTNQSSQKLFFKQKDRSGKTRALNKANQSKKQKRMMQKTFNIRQNAEALKKSAIKTVKVIATKVVVSVKAVFSLKPMLAVCAIGLITALLMVIVMVIIGLFSQVSQSAYNFTASDATKIDKAFTEKEVDYLIMLANRAEQADSNTIINFEDVGHEPHELLAFINVLLYPKFLEQEELQWVDIEEAIDVAFEARYHFDEYTEQVENSEGQQRDITYLTSNTESFDNIIGGFTGQIPADAEDFINEIGDDAAQIAEENGLYASVMIAQAILESASGSSDLASPPHYNLFGIKGSYQGETVFMKTNEDDGTGSQYTITDGFRDYPSYVESMEDYAKLMREGPSHGFYAPTWKENTTSYRDATAHLQGTYATDTSYASKLNAIIEDYNLTQFDSGYTPADESASNEANEVVEVTMRSDTDNQLEFTDFEKELYRKQKDSKGLMGTYPSPLESIDWGKQISRSYGWYWDEEENVKIEDDRLHLKTKAGQNILSQHPSKVSAISQKDGRISLVLTSEDTISFTYSNLQNVSVSEGDVLSAGQVIGQTSNQGLVLEAIDKDGEVINPQLIMATNSPMAIMQNIQTDAKIQGTGAGNVTGNADFQNPYAGNDPSTYLVMSEFGMRKHPITNEVKAHNGIDLTPIGGVNLPISSAGDGTVIYSNTDSSGSNTVTISHDSGHITRYMHLAQPSPLKEGEVVKKGDFVGYTGTTGLSTGVHLHFEIHEGQGNPVNPRKYIDW